MLKQSEILRNEFIDAADVRKKRCLQIDNQLNELPSGTIVFKKRRGRDYPYLAYRRGSSVMTDYIPSDKMQSVESSLKRRASLTKEKMRLLCEEKELRSIATGRPKCIASEYVAGLIMDELTRSTRMLIAFRQAYIENRKTARDIRIKSREVAELYKYAKLITIKQESYSETMKHVEEVCGL